MKRLVFTVTNDLSYDQRMKRICGTLAANGYTCELIGRKRSNSAPLQEESFEQTRLRCIFEKGKLFYLEYNFRLFWYLLFTKFDVICAVDLDSILPAYIVAKIRGKRLVYDAHEYFTEMQEIISRPFVHRLWAGLERFMMRRIKHAYTISHGYAKLFNDRYGKTFEVIRNVPARQPLAQATKSDPFIIYQGALNVGRGLEESISAMKLLDQTTLKIYGDGPKRSDLEHLAQGLQLNGHIQFKGSIEPSKLPAITRRAWCGLTLFSDQGLHHKYSLANRFFDYIHAGIPQIAIDFPEYRAFNDEYEVAVLIDDLSPQGIAQAVNNLYYDQVHYDRLRDNCARAQAENCWEKESIKLLQFYRSL